jgi:hypothetical protein
MTLRRNLKHSFLPFSTGAKEQLMPQRVGKPLPTSADLDHRELDLVNELTQLLAAARFHIITDEVGQQADAKSEGGGHMDVGTRFETGAC